jgi:acetoacetyl-CoA synthetase
MSIRPPFTSFVQLKAGCEGPPILIAHGLDGLASFSGLAKHIRTANPVYGIRAKGVDGIEEPFERIEDMAQFYLDSLKELPFHGPYILIGYSFGGLVALEMAQRLSEIQGNVALLALLDTFPHPRFMPVLERLPLFVKRMMRHGRQMRQLSALDAFSYFADGIKRRLHLPGARHDSQRPSETLGLSFAETALHRVNQKAYQAYASYRPKFYRGKIHLVSTQTETFFPKNPAAVWGHLASELEVQFIPGDHLSIVTTEYEALAALLTDYVKQVSPQHV